MQSTQDDIEVVPSSTYDSDEDSTRPQLEPIQTTGLTSDGPEEALAFDEPSSALASRVLSAHGNPSPPPSPLRVGESSLISEQLSVSPIRATRHLPVESAQPGSESSGHDASDAEVENSLILLSPLPPELVLLQPPPKQAELSSDVAQKEAVSGSTVSTQTATPLESLQPEQSEEEKVEAQNVALPPEATGTEFASPAHVTTREEAEQPQFEPKYQSPRRSTRPRKSTTPFILQAFASLPGTPVRNAEKSPVPRGKGKARTPERESLRSSLDTAALKSVASEEKRRRRKERAKAKDGEMQQELGLLSPGSSALLAQLLPSPGVEDTNPFDDTAEAVPSTEVTSSVPADASNKLEPSLEPVLPASNTDKLGFLGSPSRFPIRPSRQSTTESPRSPRRSPSPRRVPLNQTPASVRKVRFPEAGPSRIQAPLFAPPPSSPTWKSPIKPSSHTGLAVPTRTTRLASPMKPQSVDSRLPPRSSPTPESSNSSQLPFPLIASKPLSQITKSRVPVLTSVERRPPSRIPRMASKPYSNRNKAGVNALTAGSSNTVKKQSIPDQVIPEIRLSSCDPEPNEPSDRANDSPPDTGKITTSPLKRKRESNVPEPLLSKRMKPLSGDGGDGSSKQNKTPIHQHLSSTTTPTSSKLSVETNAKSTARSPSPSVEATAQKSRSPSPPQQISGLRRTTRARKAVQPAKAVAAIIPPAPRQRKPPAIRVEPETFAGMTITAFRQLTTTNTTKNQEYAVANIETEIVRIQGPRPDSPTTKVRTALQKQKEEADGERKARAERRARRSGELVSDDTGEESRGEEPDSTPPRKHARAPGDEDEYETPKRAKPSDESGRESEAEERRVRWNRGLSTTIYLDELHPTGKAHSDTTIKKGCLANSSKALIEKLDALGNVPGVKEKVDSLIREHVVVKKFVYDEDIPEPAPAKATRSKSKK